MGQTPIYALPWPELTDPADGPDLASDLANRTETVLTTSFWNRTEAGAFLGGRVMIDANIPSPGAAPAAPTWQTLLTQSFAGKKGHIYVLSGYTTWSTGGTPNTVNVQVGDNAAMVAWGPTASITNYVYAALPLNGFIACGASDRTITVLVRGNVVTAGTGAKLEHGRLQVFDIGAPPT